MTVLDSANLKLFSCQRKLTLARARNKTEDIKDLEDEVKYWSAFTDGVKAQRNEKYDDKSDDEPLEDGLNRGLDDE